MRMSKTSYVVALGSNRRHHRHGAPRAVIAAVIEALASEKKIKVTAVAPTFTTAPVGPAGRSFANSAIVVKSAKDPDKLLALLKKMERDFGRRKVRRWGPRVLDLDIILWSGGIWADGDLAIPHPAFRERRFVLDPLVRVAPEWRDPRDGLSVRQIRARQMRPKPVDPANSPA
jgi:2-amino-4-hydroxy-6-hydroxymethyldihydropteridine diphosphokinase